MTTQDVEKYIIPEMNNIGYRVINHSFDGTTGFGKIFFAKKRDILEPDYEFIYSSQGYGLFYNKVVRTEHYPPSVKRQKNLLLQGSL